MSESWNRLPRTVERVTRHGIKRFWIYGPRALWARYRHVLFSHVVSPDFSIPSPRFVDERKLISVLLPSRGCPREWFETIYNLMEKYEVPERIEILLCLDGDDPASHTVVERARNAFGETINVHALIGTRGSGYASLHKYIEELCAVSRRQFLFFFSDDAVMETGSWDTQVSRFCDEFCALRCSNPGLGVDRTSFPIVHRKVYEIIGHFSLNAMIDGWMQKIARGAGIKKNLPVRISHKDCRGATFLEANRSAKTTILPHWKSAEVSNSLAADLQRVRRYLDCYGVKLERITESPLHTAARS